MCQWRVLSPGCCHKGHIVMEVVAIAPLQRTLSVAVAKTKERGKRLLNDSQERVCNGHALRFM
jgi:hypothetical protein